MAAKTKTRKTRVKPAGTPAKKAAAKKRTATRTASVKLEGQVRIGQAAELKTRLAEALAKKTRIRIDASGVEKIDTSSMQLLAAFFIKGRGKSVPIAWHKPAEPLLAAAELLGLAAALELDGRETAAGRHRS